MCRFSAGLPIVGSLYQEEEPVHVLSRCLAEWRVSKADELWWKFLGSLI